MSNKAKSRKRKSLSKWNDAIAYIHAIVHFKSKLMEKQNAILPKFPSGGIVYEPKHIY